MHAARVRGPRDLQENERVNVHQLQRAHEIPARARVRAFAGRGGERKGERQRWSAMRAYVIVLNESEWNSGVVACGAHRWCR